MNDSHQTCYIYCRVSTEEQANGGFSLDNQKRACLDYANSNHYIVRDIFVDEGKSGRTTDRPEFQRMLKELTQYPVDAVVIYKIDRFARNVGDFDRMYKELKAKGIKLLSVHEGDLMGGNSLIPNIFASVAQWESEVNGQRTKDALMQKFREGWLPGWAPLGYKNIRNKDDKGIVIIDPETGPIIKWAFQQYATGRVSVFKLAKTLHKRGIRTRNGKPIAHSTIHQILTNPFYYGLLRYNGQEKIGNHEPLISKRLFDLCQLIAAKHRNFVIRERKHDFLLRGFVFCSRCGHRYTAEWHVNSHKLAKRGGKIAYYHCAKKSPCKSPYAEADNLEKEVAEYMKNIKFTKGFTDALTLKVRHYLKSRDKEEEKIRRGLLNKRQALVNKRKILEERLMDETIQRETFKRLHDELELDINNNDIEMAKLGTSRRFDFDLLEEVLAITRNVPKTYKEAPQFLKRRYLNFFFEKIEVDNKKIVNTAFSPLVQELINQQSVILRKNWLRTVDSVRNIIRQQNEYVYIPDLRAYANT